MAVKAKGKTADPRAGTALPFCPFFVVGHTVGHTLGHTFISRIIPLTIHFGHEKWRFLRENTPLITIKREARNMAQVADNVRLRGV